MNRRRLHHRLLARRSRCGALLSMELILVLPIVIGLVMATIEVGMLWSAGQRVHEAAAVGCRTAAFRGADEQAVRRAVELRLDKKALIDAYAVEVRPHAANPDEICFTLSVPMTAAAPDLMKFFGFSLKDRRIVAQSIMRKE